MWRGWAVVAAPKWGWEWGDTYLGGALGAVIFHIRLDFLLHLAHVKKHTQKEFLRIKKDVCCSPCFASFTL